MLLARVGCLTSRGAHRSRVGIVRRRIIIAPSHWQHLHSRLAHSVQLFFCVHSIELG